MSDFQSSNSRSCIRRVSMQSRALPSRLLPLTRVRIRCSLASRGSREESGVASVLSQLLPLLLPGCLRSSRSREREREREDCKRKAVQYFPSGEGVK